MRIKRRYKRIAFLAILFLTVTFPLLLLAGGVPPAAHRYRSTLVRNARLEWGLNAPVATFAAQVQQESGWNPHAVSRVGAVGMAQFMPSTAEWWCALKKQSDCRPDNPVWAMRALVGYDHWLWRRVDGARCPRMKSTLRAYNGGLGYVLKEARSGKPCSSFRSGAACRENLVYPRRIISIEPVYLSWGAGACHG